MRKVFQQNHTTGPYFVVGVISSLMIGSDYLFLRIVLVDLSYVTKTDSIAYAIMTSYKNPKSLLANDESSLYKI